MKLLIQDTSDAQVFTVRDASLFLNSTKLSKKSNYCQPSFCGNFLWRLGLSEPRQGNNTVLQSRQCCSSVNTCLIWGAITSVYLHLQQEKESMMFIPPGYTRIKENTPPFSYTNKCFWGYNFRTDPSAFFKSKIKPSFTLGRVRGEFCWLLWLS